MGSGSRSRLVEFQDEELAVGVKGAAGGGLGFFHGFFGEEMRDFCDDAGGRESFLDAVALEVDVGINLVSDAVVALVALESDVVSSGTDPKCFAVDQEGRFPDAQMVARSDDADGLSVGPAVILRAAEEVELAHRHGQVGFLGEALNEAVQNGGFDVGVNFHPAGVGKNALHGVLRTEDQEIDHVAGVAIFVANAAWDFRKQMVVNAGKRSDLLGAHTGGAFWDVRFGAHDVGAVSGVVGGLIDADRKPARDGGSYIAASANDEGSSNVFIANEADECTASGFVVRQNAEKVLETARQAVRSVVVFGVNVTELASGGH